MVTTDVQGAKKQIATSSGRKFVCLGSIRAQADERQRGEAGRRGVAVDRTYAPSDISHAMEAMGYPPIVHRQR